MGVCHRTDNFFRRGALGEYDSELLRQRNQDALKIQPACPPPCPDFADRAPLAAHPSHPASDDLFYGLRTVPLVRYHHIRQFMVDNPASLAAQPPDYQRPHNLAAVDDLAFPAADDLQLSTAY